VLPLAAVALVATACPAEEPEPEAPPVAEEDLEGQSVEVAAVWTGGEQASFEEVLNSFAEETGADVSYTSTGDDIAAVLGTRIEGGDPPDVAMLPQPGLMFDLEEQGALQPIEDFAGEDVDAHFAQSWRDLGSVDGTLYGVWFKAANKSTVWYNLSIFNDAGVQPPESWDDFVSTAQTISDFGVEPVSIAGADGWTLSDWFENLYLQIAGPDLYDQLTNHEIPWTHETVVETLETWADIVGDDALMVGGASGALNTDFPTSVTQVFTDPPDGAIVYEGDFVAGVITDETDAQLGTDADFFDFPLVEGAEPSVMGGGDMAVMLTDNEAAQALMRYLASPEAGEIWAARGGFTSPNQNVDLGRYPDDITRRSAEALTTAEVFRFDLSDLQPAEFGSTPGAGIWGLLQDFMRNPDDAEGIAQQLEDAAARAFR
jgi:alpha-glucoside transport system substrate-binding protein